MDSIKGLSFQMGYSTSDANVPVTVPSLALELGWGGCLNVHIYIVFYSSD